MNRRPALLSMTLNFSDSPVGSQEALEAPGGRKAPQRYQPRARSSCSSRPAIEGLFAAMQRLSIIQRSENHPFEPFERRARILKEQGLYKAERVLTSAQGGTVRTADRDVINLCANNYLGLANHLAVRGGRPPRHRPVRLRHGLGALHLRHPDRCTSSSKRR